LDDAHNVKEALSALISKTTIQANTDGVLFSTAGGLLCPLLRLELFEKGHMYTSAYVFIHAERYKGERHAERFSQASS